MLDERLIEAFEQVAADMKAKLDAGRLVIVTQSEYDALTPAADTVYVVSG